jgi:four helix bundle protein
MSTYADVTEITAWQLAHKLNLRVDLFLLSPDFRRHYQHADRLSDAVRSATRNIAEGFADDRRAFADRVRLARGSQAEVLHHLIDAYDQRLITIDELEIAERLAKRSIRAANGLIRSLEATSEDAAARGKRRSRRPIRSAPTGWD